MHRNLSAITERLAEFDRLVPPLARALLERCRDLTAQILALDRDFESLVARLAQRCWESAAVLPSPLERSSAKPPT